MYRKNAGEGNRLRDMADAGILARAALPHRTWWRVVPVSALGLLAGCAPAVLDPAGPVGTANRTLLLDSLAIMLVIVVPTILATLAFAWWFRSSNPRARRLPNWAYSGQIELVTWSIPLMTIILLGGVAWVGSHELDPARPLPSKGGGSAMEVQVVALDWKWLFIYPGQKVASLNELVIPAGMPVHFTLTSASVMNAFFVPQLGSMIYVMNGMASDLNLQADKPGVFHGLSAHYSGDGFSDMHFAVRSLDADGFARWVTATRQTGRALDSGAYAQLAKQSINDQPVTFRDVDTSLFQKIVGQQIAPGPGPEPEPMPKHKPPTAADAGGAQPRPQVAASQTPVMER